MKLEARQIRLVIMVLIAVVAVLAIIWFTMLRTTYVPVYQNIREADAAQISGALDGAGIPYRLTNNGHDILVPEDSAAEARVTVAGSNISFGGTVGFELFNDSDMGLTEFAQKINFQRAMQGELSRTIMMMEGVDFARVHLAVPERSIFRSAQGTPTAAVTIEMLPGWRLQPQRIKGIRQLIASSVPGLAIYDVAVLDKSGDLVSDSAGSGREFAGAPVNERDALESFYAAKATTTIRDVLPTAAFEVEISAREIAPAQAGEAEAENGRSSDKRDAPEREGLALRVMIRSPTDLAPEERGMIESALIEALSLDDARGDVLAYSTGPLSNTLPEESTGPQTSAVDQSPAGFEENSDDQGLFSRLADWLFTRWVVILAILGGIVLLVVWPRRRLPPEEAAEFAELLKSASIDREEAHSV